MSASLATPHSLLALLLLAVISAAADKPSPCDNELMACLSEHVMAFDHTRSDAAPEEICSLISDFSNCISDIACLSQEFKDGVITNVTATFRRLSLDCNEVGYKIVTDDADKKSMTETPVADKVCEAAKKNCSLKFVSESFEAEIHTNGSDLEQWFCPALNKYVLCLETAPCEGEEHGEEVQAEMNQIMQQAGITCSEKIDNVSVDDWDKASWEDDEDMADADEGNEQAGATLTGDKDSAPATISGMSSLPVVMSLVASLALWFRQ